MNMNQSPSCKVLVAPRIEILDRPSWTKMLDLIAEAVNIARRDGSVQILQSVSIESEGENGEVINTESPEWLVRKAYEDLVSLFAAQEAVTVKDVAHNGFELFVITLQASVRAGSRC
jgi:hypothetical protein